MLIGLKVAKLAGLAGLTIGAAVAVKAARDPAFREKLMNGPCCRARRGEDPAAPN